MDVFSSGQHRSATLPVERIVCVCVCVCVCVFMCVYGETKLICSDLYQRAPEPWLEHGWLREFLLRFILRESSLCRGRFASSDVGPMCLSGLTCPVTWQWDDGSSHSSYEVPHCSFGRIDQDSDIPYHCPDLSQGPIALCSQYWRLRRM